MSTSVNVFIVLDVCVARVYVCVCGVCGVCAYIDNNDNNLHHWWCVCILCECECV